MKHAMRFGIGAVMLALAGGGSVASAQEVTLTLGHAVFESHPFHDAAVRFAEAVEKKSGGNIKIELFPARQLGDVKELMEGVQFGTVDMTVNSSSALSSLTPAIDAFQLPYVMRTYDDFARMAVSPETDAILAKLEDHGMVGLGLYEGGQRHFLSTGAPVEAIDGFKGLKTRVAPTPLFLAVWNAAGVNPTPMAYGEVFSGLETGTIDAVEINLTSIESEKLYEAAKNVTLTGHYFWPGVMLINKGVFDGLTEEQQAILKAAAREITAPQVQAVADYDEVLKTKLAERGVKISQASDEFENQLEAAFAPVVEEYSAKSPLIADFAKAARSAAQATD